MTSAASDPRIAASVCSIAARFRKTSKSPRDCSDLVSSRIAESSRRIRRRRLTRSRFLSGGASTSASTYGRISSRSS